MNGIYTNHAFRLNRWLPRATLPITGHCTICLSSWTTIDIVGLLAPASTHCIASFITDHACLAATGLALILSSWRHKTLGSLTLLAFNNISSKCLLVFANRNQKITLHISSPVLSDSTHSMQDSCLLLYILLWALTRRHQTHIHHFSLKTHHPSSTCCNTVFNIVLGYKK